MAKLEKLTIEAETSATDFPATTLRAFLKQIDVPGLDKHTKKVLETCFPRFIQHPGQLANSAAQRARKQLNLPRVPFRKRRNVKWLITGSGVYDTRQGRYRRYAGSRDLPGARYYSVCEDESGNDGGTLCFELMSYWDSTSGLYLGLTDSTVHHAVIRQPPLDALFADSKTRLVMIVMNIDEIVIGEGGRPLPTGEVLPFRIPLLLFDLRCDNVLDLRRPAAQDWLASMCGEAENAEGFGALLPNLISPTPGGSEFHHALGAWLRAHHCLGLVYPSARRDVSVDASDKQILSSDGWNFVRYDGAPLSDVDMSLGMPYPWKTPQSIGADIYHRADDGLRSWRVQGPEAGEWGRVNYEIRRRRGLAPPPNETFNPFDDGRPERGREGTPFGPLDPD